MARGCFSSAQAVTSPGGHSIHLVQTTLQSGCWGVLRVPADLLHVHAHCQQCNGYASVQAAHKGLFSVLCVLPLLNL